MHIHVQTPYWQSNLKGLNLYQLHSHVYLCWVLSTEYLHWYWYKIVGPYFHITLLHYNVIPFIFPYFHNTHRFTVPNLCVVHMVLGLMYWCQLLLLTFLSPTYMTLYNCLSPAGHSPLFLVQHWWEEAGPDWHHTTEADRQGEDGTTETGCGQTTGHEPGLSHHHS